MRQCALKLLGLNSPSVVMPYLVRHLGGLEALLPPFHGVEAGCGDGRLLVQLFELVKADFCLPLGRFVRL